MKNNTENSQSKANSSSLLPENILHEKWNKRNSEEMELFEELIDHCKKKKFKTVLTILEENTLIPPNSRKICDHCQNRPELKNDLNDCYNPQIACSCGKIRINLKDHTIFQSYFRPLGDQLSLLQGFMTTHAISTLAKKSGVNESIHREYFDGLHDRFDWFLEEQTKISVNELCGSEKTERQFSIDRHLTSLSTRSDSFVWVAGIYEQISNLYFFKLCQRDEDYFNWIKEIIPENYYPQSFFLTEDITEKQLILTNFPDAQFYDTLKTIFRSEQRSTDEDTMGCKLNALFSAIEGAFKHYKNGRNWKNLQRTVNSLLFRANGINSFLEFYQFENEMKYQENILRLKNGKNNNNNKLTDTDPSSIASSTKKKVYPSRKAPLEESSDEKPLHEQMIEKDTEKAKSPKTKKVNRILF
jgi:hypothetical protein